MVVVAAVVEYCCRGRAGEEMDNRLKLVELHPPAFVAFVNGVASGWMMAYYIIIQAFFFSSVLYISIEFEFLEFAPMLQTLSNKLLNEWYVRYACIINQLL